MVLKKKLLLSSTIIVALCFSLIVSAEAASTMWSQTGGGLLFDNISSLAATSDGGYALAGSTDSFSIVYSDAWLIKTDELGNMEWNKTYGGTGDDWAWSFVTTTDEGYALAGYTKSYGAGDYDFWLIKTDESGNMEWNKTYGGIGEDLAFSIAETTDGGYALAGYTESFGMGNTDCWLIKTDEQGNMEWNKTYGGTHMDSSFEVIETSDGGYAIAGSTMSFGAGSYDSWLIKTDENGTLQWNQTYGGTNIDTTETLMETPDGGYAIVGSTMSFGAGSYDFWLVKTNSTGNMEWNQTYGGTGYDWAYAFFDTPDGGYALAGSTDSFGAGSSDFWLVKTDSSGNIEWNQTYGGTESDGACSVVATSDGGCAMAGWTGSFGATSQDFWLVKTDALLFNYDFMFNLEENNYRVIILSNSTIGDCSLETEEKQLSFNVTGLTGTTGFCNISIPNDLLWGDFTVNLNETEIVEGVDYTITENGTHNIFSIAYSHSSHTITITSTYAVPEYSSWIVPSLLLIATLFVALNKKKLFNQSSQHKQKRSE